MDTSETKYIYFRESLVRSVLADLFSFGMLIFTFWVNAEYIESKVLAGFILLVCMMGVLAEIIGRAKKFYSKEELKEYVNNL